MTTPATSAPTVTSTTRVVLRPLSMRQDGDSWVIGRIDTGDFITMPAVGQHAMMLLGEGRTVGDVAQILNDTGADIDIADFVAALDALHFLRSIDDQPRGGPVPPRPSLPWLQPQHVRWLLHPALPWAIPLVISATCAIVIANPTVAPNYRDLVWSPHTGIVLAANAAFGWTLVWLHELGHLTTARAAGAPARFSLSTRLQFLVAQTDVSGIWAAPRRARLTVYLAGMAVNLIIASILVLLVGLIDPHGLTRQLLECVALESLLMLPFQLLIFMRTDLYFVVQDLANCTNLYADGTAYIRYLTRRIRHHGRGTGDTPSDPSRLLPPHERRSVRAYSWVLLCGTTVCLTVAVLVTIPTFVTLLTQLIEELAGRSLTGLLDGTAALLVSASFQILWACAWWRRHGPKIRSHLQAWKHRPSKR